ncbi:MAG TPA: hypothetical protein DEB31_06925 [Clostridiales bacterium]|nr:hypothetical protein [Clostridiales bacterium]
MKRRIREKSGASIFFALILMIVLLTIGTSVLAAATATMNSAASLIGDKQLYYAARSVADTVTRGILEDTDMAEAWENYIIANWSEMENAAGTNPPSFQCALSATGLPNGGRLTISPLTVFPPRVHEGALTGSTMRVEFIVSYGAGQYAMAAKYQYRPGDADASPTGWIFLGYEQNV